MIVLNEGDKIQGDAEVASVIDCTIYGSDSGTPRQLAEDQLASSIGDLYQSDSVDIVNSIVLVNTDSVARTLNLYVLPVGGTARRLVPKNVSLGAGYSMYFDGASCTVMDTGGQLIVNSYGSVSDIVFGLLWKGITTIAPSKSAVYSLINTIVCDDGEVVIHKGNVVIN